MVTRFSIKNLMNSLYKAVTDKQKIPPSILGKIAVIVNYYKYGSSFSYNCVKDVFLTNLELAPKEVLNSVSIIYDAEGCAIQEWQEMLDGIKLAGLAYTKEQHFHIEWGYDSISSTYLDYAKQYPDIVKWVELQVEDLSVLNRIKTIQDKLIHELYVYIYSKPHMTLEEFTNSISRILGHKATAFRENDNSTIINIKVPSHFQSMMLNTIDIFSIENKIRNVLSLPVKCTKVEDGIIINCVDVDGETELKFNINLV